MKMVYNAEHKITEVSVELQSNWSTDIIFGLENICHAWQQLVNNVKEKFLLEIGRFLSHTYTFDALFPFFC